MTAPVDVLAALRRSANAAANMADRLGADVRPGHIDHMTKAEAAVCCGNLSDDLEAIRAAVAELIERGDYLVRTGEGMLMFKAALARCKGGQP